MQTNKLINELSEYFEDYTIECLNDGKNKLKSDGNRYSTYIADIKDEYLTYCKDNPTVVIKEIAADKARIYSMLSDIYNPYLETIYDVIALNDTIVSINEFVETPKILSNWDKRSITLEQFVLGENNITYPRLSEKEALIFLYQMCEGLSSLHKLGFHHGDITPKNILLTDSIVVNPLFDFIDGIHRKISVKIIDFDISTANKYENEPLTSIMGTDLYAAPDIMDFSKPRDQRIDIYSLGCILGFMLTGKSPKKENIRSQVSEKCWYLIKRCTDTYDHRIKSVKQLQNEILKLLNVSSSAMMKWLSYVPGFRSGNVINAAIASAYYGTFIVIIGTFINPKQLLLYSFIVITNILKILIFFDCFGIFSRKFDTVQFFIKHRLILPFIRIFITLILELIVCYLLLIN